MRRAVSLLVVVSFMLAAPLVRAAPRSEFHYVTMSDGVKIAIAVTYPPSFEADPLRRWPTMFHMHGYPWSVSAPGPDASYVTVVASVRGTGCSGGQFELFSDRSSLDGYEVIEDWIVQQPWSNGRVGIQGHSYLGLTGFLVAATQPPSVKAVAVSGLIEDFYRGITYPGGVFNRGFPVNWSLGFYNTTNERTALAVRGQDEAASGDPTCVANMATRGPQYPFLQQAAVERWDSAFWQQAALASKANRIAAPIHIGHQYQDEQTGPSGNILWEKLPTDLPKRLVLSNGEHATRSQSADARRWLDCWVLHDGQGCAGDTADPTKRVQVYFETQGEPGVAPVLYAPLAAGDFPLPATDWARYYLDADGALGGAPPPTESRSTFRTLTMGHPGSLALGPDPASVVYRRAFASDTAFAGPAAATVWAEIDGADADVFVEIIDEAPDGRWQHLQRGILRASHRALDEAASLRVQGGEHDGALIRPRHPHRPPGEPSIGVGPVRLDIEIPTFGHVFRAGHTMVLRISSPPETDPVGGTYQYASELPSVPVHILAGGGFASSILLPMLDVLPPMAPLAPGCGGQQGLRCVEHAEPQVPSATIPPPPEPDPQEPDPSKGFLVAGTGSYAEASGGTPWLSIAVSVGGGTQLWGGSFVFKHRTLQVANTNDPTAIGLWIERVEKTGTEVRIEWSCIRNGEPGHRCVTIIDDTGRGGDFVRVELDDDLVAEGNAILASDYVVA